jgi:hypothetical protein
MYEPFGPFTMISETRFLLVLSRRIRLLIEENDGGKGATGRKGFLAIIYCGILGSQGRIFVKNKTLA